MHNRILYGFCTCAKTWIKNASRIIALTCSEKSVKYVGEKGNLIGIIVDAWLD